MRQRDSGSDDLLTVSQLAKEYGLGRSTVWLNLRRHQVPRYRTSATGKTTLVRRGDWEQALKTPVQVLPKKNSNQSTDTREA